MTAFLRASAGLHPASARLPDEGELPSFDGATEWLNPAPLTSAGLRRKVVLIDFWTLRGADPPARLGLNQWASPGTG